MKSLTTVARTLAVAVAAGAVLAGCSSTDTKASDTTTTTVTSTEQSTTAKASGPTNIRDYIDSNGIKETVIRRGEPGPEINLPVPAGWEIKNDVKAAPYGAIVYTKPAIATNPPRILAILSKLTGDVDPQKLLELAPGELQQIPGWDGPSEATKSKLDGYSAVQIGGSYSKEGTEMVIAQKTVVIPARDGSYYILQLNAYAPDAEKSILIAATDEVDEKTTIKM